MFSKVSSVLAQGICGCMLRVEANVCDGLPNFIMVGYLSGDLKEAKARVLTAIRNAGYPVPPKHITVNLSPADIRKEGSAYDLPIAVSVLAAMGYIHNEKQEEYIMIGELSLDGHVNPVHGIMPMVLCARDAGYTRCIVPLANCREAMLTEEIEVFGAGHLSQVVDYLNTGDPAVFPPLSDAGAYRDDPEREPDFTDICGQEAVKRAAEVAAAGMHNLLMAGPPGSGKSMIARHIPSILPPLTKEESLEITKIYSISGMLDNGRPLIDKRPFRAPHHTVTGAGLVGGGRIPKPGEISFAHHGV